MEGGAGAWKLFLAKPGISRPTQITLRGVTTLRSTRGTHLCCPRTGKTDPVRRRRHTSERAHTRLHANNYISNSYAHPHARPKTRLGSVTTKRVWNESRACCAVGRLLTHASTPASGHAALLWASQRRVRGWRKTISCIISHSELSLTGASVSAGGSSERSRELNLGYPFKCFVFSAIPRPVIYPDWIFQLLLGALFCQHWGCK